MVTPNSPDISNLNVCVQWDISGTSPKIVLTQQSTGPNLANVSYAFLIKSPSQTIINDGNLNMPTIVGLWTEWTFFSTNPDPTLSPPPTDYTVAPWPRPFNQIEWSGAPYSIEIMAKDSEGNEFSYVVTQEICRPAGNTNTSTNTYGKGNVTINLNCVNANAFFENITNTNYKGLAGTQQSSVLKVLYPDDETDTAPTPFIVNDFSNAIVPITYDSDNYEFVYNGIWLYEFANCSSVLIKYYTKRRFSVNCNIDLCPLVCEVERLIQQSETGNCANLQEINEKLLLINGKLNLALIAKTQPLCGIDLPALIEEIKIIGDFDCDCCSPSGIQPFNSANLADYNFSIRTGCGDITGYPEITGNNITFILSDKSYIFKMCDDVPTDAFTVLPSTAGCTKTYCLNVNLTTLSTDILNTIKNNTDLVNLFNSIVNVGSGNFELVVNMACISDSGDACDYSFTLEDIPNTPSNALINIILSSIDGYQRIINYAFNLSTLGTLQTYLNTLGIGTFVVSNPSGNTVVITTANNTYALTGMIYVSGGSPVKRWAEFNADCTGFVARTANQVVQAIIDYLCGLTDHQIVTSQAYEICYIDPADNTKKIVTVAAGTAENTFIAQLLDRNCDTVDYLIALSGLNCQGLKNIFTYNPALLQTNDFLFGTKNGFCAGINPVEAFTRMLQLGTYNADCVAAFCAFVKQCQGGFACEPYSIFQVEVVEGSPTNLMDIVVTFTHPSAISNTIRYARIDNTNNPVYTTIPNVLPGDSPYTISGVADGDYFVGITPIYADGRACAEVSTTTGACSGITAFSASINGSDDIVVTWTADSDLAKVEVQINYPNGGVASTVYTASLGTATITPPVGVYGDYFITLIPVCNVATGFKGLPTAPVILPVTPPSNSTFTNNTTNALTPISMIIYSNDLGQYLTPFSAPTVASGGGVINFYLPDGTYSKCQVTYPTGIVGVGYLTSASGVLVGAVQTSQITFNDPANPIIVSGGIQIVVLDSSP